MDQHLPSVEAAPVQIQQVLLNLIMNALAPSKGLPPVERRIIVSTRSLEGERVEVSVRDFGTGLPNKVFDHSFSTKQTGMGMGLTIVRSIIEMHGARSARKTLPTAERVSPSTCPRSAAIRKATLHEDAH
jgi:two-component system sensor kinase FixL